MAVASGRQNAGRIRVQDLAIAEDVKISIEKALKLFLDDDSASDYAFPSSLTNEERKFIHNVAHIYNLKTKSRDTGRGERQLVAFKRDAAVISRDSSFDLQPTSQQMVMALLTQNPLTERERRELAPAPRYDRNRNQGHGQGADMVCTTGRLNPVIPQTPPPVDMKNLTEEVIETRENLPIRKFRSRVISEICNNRVLLISGETGCGKTTQVPQYILEHACETGQSCRILVSEPRRLAALSVADRVSQERGEALGQLVGYQIRLESKVSPRTLLTFCTNGVLLRTLMGGDSALQNVTHIIVDEVHERDRFSDLLLAVIREMLTRMPQLTLILMSATFDTERFVQYFGGCSMLSIPGRLYEVRSFFLEDILRLTKYKDKEMQSYARDYQLGKKREATQLISWCQEGEKLPAAQPNDDDEFRPKNPVIDTSGHEKEYEQLDELLKLCWSTGAKGCFEDMLSLFINEDLNVDYSHPDTGVTALIVSSARGMIDFVDAFLRLGANIHIRTKLNDFDAKEWANYFNHSEVEDLIGAYAHSSLQERERDADEVAKAKVISEEDKQLLEAYHRTFNDDVVDLDLAFTLIKHICLNAADMNAILVFLPGYDEIVTLKHMIADTFRCYGFSDFVLFTLHSQMQNEDHRRVFQKPPEGKRKIILSTNIAETSVTIEDVVYVIDSGKVKQKSYDTTTGMLELKAERISQSNAIQRRGRAGRLKNGICYHLYSRFRFDNLPKYQVPEIVRMPAHELCLQLKLLCPNRQIMEFMSRLPEPPPEASVKSSIVLLKAIDAIDSSENLTELGLLLLDLPIEPHLGKVVLHAVVMKCLDPILTIVCSLTYKDPFLMPPDMMTKKEAQNAKQKLSCNSLSDHMTMLRAFQSWQKAKCDGLEDRFCRSNFISPSTMEMIFGIRTQLLGQLRASGFVRARGPNDIRDLNTNSDNWAVVKGVLSAGYYPNVLRFDATRGLLMSRKDSRLAFHPSSVLSSVTSDLKKKKHPSFPSEWFIYDELCRSGRRSLARTCTIISPVTLALMAGPVRLPPDAFSSASNDGTVSCSEEEPDDLGPITLKIDDWITFRLKHEVGHLIWQLRQKWHALFLRRISSPGRTASNADSMVIKTMADILNLEEQGMGMQQPVGVGQRPAPMATSFCSPVIPNSAAFSQLFPGNRSSFSGRHHPQQQQQLTGAGPARSAVLRSPRSQNQRRF